MLARKLEPAAGRVIAFFAMAVLITLGGCAGIEPPSPDYVVRHPLGTESIKIGMTKSQVEALWGKPDDIKMVEDKDKWKGTREVWTYRAQYGNVPVDAGYFSKNKKLYFDGNNLTNISD